MITEWNYSKIAIYSMKRKKELFSPKIDEKRNKVA